MSEVSISHPNTSVDELLERQRTFERSNQQARINPYVGEVMLLYFGLRNPFTIAAEATSLAMAPEQVTGQELSPEELEELERQRAYDLAA